MKVLFLDIDGVLNTPKDRLHTNPDDCLTPRLLGKLDKLIQETGCSIVISSTWRLRHTVESLQEVFAQHGFSSALSIVGFTPYLESNSWDNQMIERGHEIQQWLEEHPDVTHFAILDDTPDMLHLSDHLVLVDDTIGITDKNLDQVKSLLNL